jgi:manganese transport protein
MRTFLSHRNMPLHRKHQFCWAEAAYRTVALKQPRAMEGPKHSQEWRAQLPTRAAPRSHHWYYFSPATGGDMAVLLPATGETPSSAHAPGGPMAFARFVAPTILASSAYIDPGNFATDIIAGGRYGYRLLWVVLLANVAAMLFQALAAKLGIVSDRSLARLCRESLPAPIVYPMWFISEIGAMATDLAELLGTSVGLAILFGTPLLAGTIVAGAVTWGILLFERRRFAVIEKLTALLIGAVAICYGVETALVRPDWHAVAYHSVVPWLGGSESMVIAAGIVGATVMPHAIYLHSSLAAGRMRAANPAEQRQLVRSSHLGVILTLGMVGLANMAILFVSTVVFGGDAAGDVDIVSAHATLGPLVGSTAAAVFMIALLASGLSSSVVGTLAGQIIMQDFLRWRIPLWLRRLLTLVPTVAIVAYGVDATQALVISQVVLSLVLPVPLIALVAFTSTDAVMGPLANGTGTRLAAIAATLVVVSINALLLVYALGGSPLR